MFNTSNCTGFTVETWAPGLGVAWLGCDCRETNREREKNSNYFKIHTEQHLSFTRGKICGKPTAMYLVSRGTDVTTVSDCEQRESPVTSATDVTSTLVTDWNSLRTGAVKSAFDFHSQALHCSCCFHTHTYTISAPLHTTAHTESQSDFHRDKIWADAVLFFYSVIAATDAGSTFCWHRSTRAEISVMDVQDSRSKRFFHTIITCCYMSQQQNTFID